MLDRLNSFRSYFISEIQNMVELHYPFYWQLDVSAYIMDLLYKNKFFCDNMDNLGHS